MTARPDQTTAQSRRYEVLEAIERIEQNETDAARVNDDWTFWEALGEWAISGQTEYLADFFRDPDARATISTDHWLVFAHHLESLRKRLRGNPHNPPRDEDVYEAAKFFDKGLQRLRETRGRAHVSTEDRMSVLDNAIKQYANKKGISIHKHSAKYANLERQIFNAWKSGRFKKRT
jgi:hypothetical protein